MDPIVYLVRHGTHDWLRPGRNRLAGRLPVQINEDGRREAERVAATLADRPLAWIATSPLPRTVETAEIIARGHELDAQHDDRLLEWALGPWEGMAVEAIQAEYPREWWVWRHDPQALLLHGAERLADVADRMEAAYQAWRVRGGDGVIVSHQDPLAALLCRLIGMPLARMRVLEIRTGGLSIVRHMPDGPAVDAVNSGTSLT